MPGERRRSSFGGSLIGRPQPLPDDDPAGPPAETAPRPSEDPPAPEQQRSEARPHAAKAPTQAQGAASKPPVARTVRLNDQVAGQLWEAFDRAKRDDPYLTRTAFNSAIVADGLAREAARRRRQS